MNNNDLKNELIGKLVASGSHSLMLGKASDDMLVIKVSAADNPSDLMVYICGSQDYVHTFEGSKRVIQLKDDFGDRLRLVFCDDGEFMNQVKSLWMQKSMGAVGVKNSLGIWVIDS
ncbi:hypothetical protein QTV49_000408 [Vibrio vulnificus]|nr:hypothetical protein [Vibrio vulnificus]